MTIGRGRLSVLTGFALLALTITGGLLAPRSYDPPLVPEEEAIHGLPGAPARESEPIPDDGTIVSEPVEVPVQGDDLTGTVVRPAVSGPHPAVVWVHGAGSTGKGEFAKEATILARAGVASLIFDKRTNGYNFRHRDFELLADDALAAVDVLRKRPDIDPSRVGMWGVSEGTWVVPIAAAKSTAVGFVVLVSPPVVSPIRQITWALKDQMERVHAPGGAQQMMARATATAATDGFTFLRHDIAPLLRKMPQPVLAMYGTGDPSLPFAESARTLASAMEKGGNDALTIRFFENADHALTYTGRKDFVPGYLETLTNWISGLPDTATPPADARVAGAAPEQRYMAIDLPQAPWYGSIGVLVAGLAIVGVSYLAGPSTALVMRLRRRDSRTQTGEDATVWPALRTRLRWLTWSGIAQIATFVAFVGVMVYFSLNQSGNALFAQTGWLVVRLCALLMLVMEVKALAAVWAGIRGGWRPAVQQQVAVFGVTGGTGLLLVAAAYYGLFTFGW